MIILDTEKMFKPVSYVAAAISEWRLLQQLEGRVVPQTLSLEVRAGFLKSIDYLKENADRLGLSTTHNIIETGFQDALDQLTPNRPLTAHELQRVILFGDKALSVFSEELRSRALVSLAPGQAHFLTSQKPFFGENVEEIFLNASQEIRDAGKCRSCGLWTASVMHLMRALEDAIGVLAESLRVEVGQNWNAALNQIDSELRKRRKSEFGPEEEQWASETSAHLRAIKNAWRNHAQHGRARYNEEEAVAIWNNVESLMRTLAKKLQSA